MKRLVKCSKKPVKAATTWTIYMDYDDEYGTNTVTKKFTGTRRELWDYINDLNKNTDYYNIDVADPYPEDDYETVEDLYASKDNYGAVSGDMTIEEFMQNIRDLYAKYFPNSTCQVKLVKSLGTALWIDCYLAKDASECENNIAGNDMFHVSFWFPNDFEGLTKDDPVPNNLNMEVSQKTIKTAPENRYMAFGSETLPFRKAKGTPDKILKTLDKYFKTLHDTTEKLVEEDRLPYKDRGVQNEEFVKSKL